MERGPLSKIPKPLNRMAPESSGYWLYSEYLLTDTEADNVYAMSQEEFEAWYYQELGVTYGSTEDDEEEDLNHSGQTSINYEDSNG